MEKKSNLIEYVVPLDIKHCKQKLDRRNEHPPYRYSQNTRLVITTQWRDAHTCSFLIRRLRLSGPDNSITNSSFRKEYMRNSYSINTIAVRGYLRQEVFLFGVIFAIIFFILSVATVTILAMFVSFQSALGAVALLMMLSALTWWGIQFGLNNLTDTLVNILGPKI